MITMTNTMPRGNALIEFHSSSNERCCITLTLRVLRKPNAPPWRDG
jgi:hypothetical protein